MFKLLIAVLLLGIVVSTKATRERGRELMRPYAFWCGAATVALVAAIALTWRG